jgi:hypothetical protein
VQAEFAFGKTGLSVSLPDGRDYTVIESRSAGPLADADGRHRSGAGSPDRLGAPGLARRRKAHRRHLRVRHHPARAELGYAAAAARAAACQAGIPVEGITILIATGLHRGATDDGDRSIVGAEIAARYRVVSHDAKAFAEHRYRWDRQPARHAGLHRQALSWPADLHITLGFIEQHLMLGFSGGRKLIAPGLAAQETIKVIHSPRFMREPLATEGEIGAQSRCTPSCSKSPAWRATTSCSMSP